MKEHFDKLLMSDRDLSLTKDGGEVFEINLSNDDLAPVPNVESVNYLEAMLTAMDADKGYIVKVELDGEVILDEYEKKKDFAFHVQTEDYLNLSGEGDELDITPDQRGLFDFLPAIKAIFYWAIPVKEKKEIYPTSGPGFEVIDAEKLKNRPKEDDFQENPFKKAFSQKK